MHPRCDDRFIHIYIYIYIDYVRVELLFCKKKNTNTRQGGDLLYRWVELILGKELILAD